MSKRNGKSDSKALAKTETTVVPSEETPGEQDTGGVASLPFWQQRYLIALRGGATEDAARKIATVSPASISKHLRESPQFARAHAGVVAGVAVMGVSEARSLAEASTPDLVNDALLLSRNRDPETGEVMQEPVFGKDGEIVGHRDMVKPRDRLQAQRLVHEVAGTIQSRNAPTVAVQVNVFQDGSQSVHAANLYQEVKRKREQDKEVVDGRACTDGPG